MKNNFPHCLTNFLFLLLVSITFSCDFTIISDASTDKLLVKAEKNLKKYPDSTLQIANKLLYLSSKNAISNEKQLVIYQLKHRVFSKLEIMDSVCLTGQKIREVASRIPDSLAIAETLLRLYGNIDYKYLKEAKPYISGAITTFGSRNKEFEKGIVIELYGNIMNEEGDYKKSQNYYLKALKIFEAKDSTYAMSRVNNELGVNFACTGIINKSNDYYLKALKIAEIRKDSFQRSSILQNFGINFKKSNPTKAIEIYNQALGLLPKKVDDMERIRLNYNIANVYYEQNNFDMAEVIYKRVLDVANKKKYQDGIVVSNIALGNTFAKKKQFAIAESYFLTTLKILEKTNQKNLILMILPKIIELYESSGDYKKAYDYSNQLIKLKDNLINAEKTKSILELEKKYQTEKKDLEILNLEKLNSLRYKIIFVLLIALLIVLYLWRQRNRLYHENKNA
jgi:tetratricopeptide (TPR) repeat protein